MGILRGAVIVGAAVACMPACGTTPLSVPDLDGGPGGDVDSGRNHRPDGSVVAGSGGIGGVGGVGGVGGSGPPDAAVEDARVRPGVDAGTCGDGVLQDGERCDGEPCCNDTCDGLAGFERVCRPAIRLCDVAERCDGVSLSCPPDAFQPRNAVCRSSVGACDPAETCTGNGPRCPADVSDCNCVETDLGSATGRAVASGSTLTEDDDLPQGCADGGSADHVLRFTAPSAGVFTFDTVGSSYDTALSLWSACDGDELACNDDWAEDLQSSITYRLTAGQSVLVVVDGFSGERGNWVLNITAPARCGNGVRDSGELCDGEPCCNATCDGPVTSGRQCRPPAGLCDAAEVCNGVGFGCPPDRLLPSTAVCRASVGACDPAETCTGNSARCPADVRDCDCVEDDLGMATGQAVARGNTLADDDDLPQSCAADGSADHVLRFTAPVTGSYRFDTIGSGYDTALSLWSACDGSELACDDDGGGDLLSSITYRLLAGQSILVVVDGFSADRGAWVLNITAPDYCGNGVRDSGEVCDGEPCCNATCDGPAGTGRRCRAAAGVCDAPEMCDGTSLSCPPNRLLPSSTVCRPSAGACDVAESCTGNSAACPPDGFRPSTRQCRPSTGMCDPAESCTGSSPRCPADANGCGCVETDIGASTGPGVASGDTTGADNDFSQSCAAGGSADHVVQFTAPSTGTYTFDTVGSSYDTALTLWSGCGGSELACDDDSAAGLQSLISYPMNAGDTVLVVVDGYSSNRGSWVLNITPPPTQCVERDIGSGMGSGIATGTTVGEDDDFPHSCAGGDGPDHVIQFTAPVRGTYSFDTDGSSYDTALTLWNGCGGSELACDDNAGAGTQSRIVRALAAGQTVLVVVDGANGATGSWILNVGMDVCGNGVIDPGEACDGEPCCNASCDGPIASGVTCRASRGACDVPEVCTGASFGCPPNAFAPNTVVCRGSTADCDPAERCDGSRAACPADVSMCTCVETEIGSATGPAVARGDTTLEDDDLPQSCASGGSADRVIEFTAPSAGDYTFDTTGSSYDTALSLWTGCGGSELACDDDGGTGLLSSITTTLAEGQTILVVVDGFSGSRGSWVLNITPGSGCGSTTCPGENCTEVRGSCVYLASRDASTDKPAARSMCQDLGPGWDLCGSGQICDPATYQYLSEQRCDCSGLASNCSSGANVYLHALDFSRSLWTREVTTPSCSQDGTCAESSSLTTGATLCCH